MSLANGDLTTQQRLAFWLANPPTVPSALLAQLIVSMSDLIYSRLNRVRTYSQTFTRTFDGVGNDQLLLPDYPVTSVGTVQMDSAIVLPSPLPNPTTGVIPPPNYGYGYRFIPWSGVMPGDPAMLEFVNGVWQEGRQNIKITYNCGYLVSGEAATVPTTPFQVTAQQTRGVWCRDGGVTYSNGTALTATTTTPPTVTGTYNVPADATPGVYTFAPGDSGAAILLSYSFIPASLEEACIQMVAERYAYRSRIGEESKSLGGQETVRFMRGDPGYAYRRIGALPPEVMDLIQPYISVIPPAWGAPV